MNNLIHLDINDDEGITIHVEDRPSSSMCSGKIYPFTQLYHVATKETHRGYRRKHTQEYDHEITNGSEWDIWFDMQWRGCWCITIGFNPEAEFDAENFFDTHRKMWVIAQNKLAEIMIEETPEHREFMLKAADQLTHLP